jgi:hypothetical protein
MRRDKAVLDDKGVLRRVPRGARVWVEIYPLKPAHTSLGAVRAQGCDEGGYVNICRHGPGAIAHELSGVERASGP